MKKEFLGDSYDAVKRMWREVLRDTAPLYAAPKFVPEDIRSDYSRLTGIPVLVGEPSNRYSILNDPDTGIRLPHPYGKSRGEGRTHIEIWSISDQLADEKVYCVVTFDQTDYRNLNLTRHQQRGKKCEAIIGSGLHAFYYASHAPFMFAFKRESDMHGVIKRIKEFGIPDERIERHP